MRRERDRRTDGNLSGAQGRTRAGVLSFERGVGMKGSGGAFRSHAVVFGVVICLLGSVALAAPVGLLNGVPVEGLSGQAGSEQYYTVVVPNGADEMVVRIFGGTGDCDLYLRQGAEPTTAAYDHRPYKVGNDESVVVTSPVAGIWYIMLRGFADYADLTLEVTYTASAVAAPLTNGTPLLALAGAVDSEQFYQLDVPFGRSKLEIRISGGTGDCDLYVKKDALPTTEVYDYRPFLLGNDESVVINEPEAGTWYILLKGYRAYADVTLVASAFATASGEPAYSALKITGNGSLTLECGDWCPYVYPIDRNIATGLWPDIVAEDPSGDDSTSVSGSHEMEWMLDYAPSASTLTKLIANFTVSPSLFSGSAGGFASADYVIKLELLGVGGTTIDSDEVRPESLVVADGEEFSDPIPVSLSVMTPDRMIDGCNNSIIRLTASATVEAFTSGLVAEDPKDGAIVLSNGAAVGGLKG
ncbi:MAG TPA: hypothetical protein ENO14_01085, partial [Chromatiales bacterium]|nr:hypothetical protein [Chromatiales bacterium]